MRVILTKETAQNIRELLKKKGMKFKATGGKIGVSENAVYAWWNRGRLPRIDTLVNLAELLGCTIDDLLITKEV